jgi:hypothetical protein
MSTDNIKLELKVVELEGVGFIYVAKVVVSLYEYENETFGCIKFV